MSIQAAKDFLKKIETDHALQEKLKAASGLESRQQIIQAAGFDFTLEEYKQAIEEAAAAAGKQLTAEELEAVAGGLGIRMPTNRYGAPLW
ncbi:MAG: Nif11-like leader peptide family natural product precursor [Syntrophales bacterium]|nr:Nif11-like leader peptide family natural product precursor [Syntrophales bacterium]MDD5640209.1 Nif11-like leader peptide family natural product precursor [Syntrophales bacterium]